MCTCVCVFIETHIYLNKRHSLKAWLYNHFQRTIKIRNFLVHCIKAQLLALIVSFYTYSNFYWWVLCISHLGLTKQNAMNWGRKQQRFVFSQFWRLGSPGLFLVRPVFRCVSGCLLTVLQSRERKRSLSSSSYKTARPIKLELMSLWSPVWVLSCSVMSDSFRPHVR